MSKARLFQAIKTRDLDALRAVLEASPALREATDERGCNALHLPCARPCRPQDAARSVKLAEYLLDAGFEDDKPAFVEGTTFKATPLWYSISRAAGTSPWRGCSFGAARRPSTASGRPASTTTSTRSISW